MNVGFLNGPNHSKPAYIDGCHLVLGPLKSELNVWYLNTIQKPNPSPTKQLWTIQNPSMFIIRAPTVSGIWIPIVQDSRRNKNIGDPNRGIVHADHGLLTRI